MTYDRACVRILEEDYEEFLKLIPRDSKLPPDYRDWLKRVVAENKTCVARGGSVTEITVTPDDFSEYCKALGAIPSYFLLEFYAMQRVGAH